MTMHCESDDDGDDDWGTELGQLIAKSRENSLRKKIGKLMAAGDCHGASKLAYESGRLELGAQLARSCSEPRVGTK